MICAGRGAGRASRRPWRNWRARNWFSDATLRWGTRCIQLPRGKWTLRCRLEANCAAKMDAIKAFISRKSRTNARIWAVKSVRAEALLLAGKHETRTIWQRDESGGGSGQLKVGSTNVDAIARDRVQLWAEAVPSLSGCDAWWLESEEADRRRPRWPERRPDDTCVPISRVSSRGGPEVTTKRGAANDCTSCRRYDAQPASVCAGNWWRWDGCVMGA